MANHNPRHGVPHHLVNIDLGEYATEVAVLQRSMTVAFVVAPRCTVPTRRGVLGAGEAIDQTDLEALQGSDGYHQAPWRRFRDLVHQGVILERL